jgi:capsular exopolysaccharide synthesis family protein
LDVSTVSPTSAESESALGGLFRLLRKRALFVAVPLVLVPAAALVISLVQVKQYTATSELLFRDPGFDQKLFGSSVLAPSTDPTREAATNVRLVGLEEVANRAARALHSDGADFTATQIQQKVSVSAGGQSDVVQIKATDHRPRVAALLANTIARQYIAFRREADRSKINEALALVQDEYDRMSPSERSSSEGRTLQNRISQLQILASLQTGNAELVQPAPVPTAPSSPKPVRNTLIGLVLGGILGLICAAVAEQLDRRVKGRAEMEAIFGRPTLGAVPEDAALDARGGLGVSPVLEGATAEAFRMIRANIRYFDANHDIKSVVVTSSGPAEGKSTVSWHLACTAAAAGSKVVFVEADLRRPGISQRLGPGTRRGLADVLSGEASREEAMQAISVSAAGTPIGTIDVLVAGRLPTNPTALLESSQMRDLIVSLEREYDLVVIDTPPVLVVPDAFPVLRNVSGVLVVYRDKHTTRSVANELHRALENLGVTPIGLVANYSTVTGSSYYGYYGYEGSTGSNGSAASRNDPPGVGTPR